MVRSRVGCPQEQVCGERMIGGVLVEVRRAGRKLGPWSRRETTVPGVWVQREERTALQGWSTF